MIKKIELHNFKSHLNSEVSFDTSRLHALVGPNSSGKTTILQALYYLGQLTKHPFSEVFRGITPEENLITVGKKESKVIVFGTLEEGAIPWSGSFSWVLSRNGRWEPTATVERFGGTQTTEGWEAKLNSLTETSLGKSAYLKLSADQLAQAAYSDEVSPKIAFDGTGLAPALDSLKYEAPDKFNTLQRFLKQIVPSVQEIGIRRAIVPINHKRTIEINGQVIPYDESKEMTGQEIIFNMASGERIPANAISEGTIITLGLLAVIMGKNQPNLILLDDIEQGLHPKAQIELIQVLKKIIYTNPDLQIIFTTHSPYIIDELEPSQVHVLNTTAEGYSAIRRMDKHPNVQRGMEVLTTGEFWDAEGEDWILAGEVSG